MKIPRDNDLNAIPYVLIDPNSNAMFDELADCTHFLFRHSQETLI